MGRGMVALVGETTTTTLPSAGGGLVILGEAGVRGEDTGVEAAESWRSEGTGRRVVVLGRRGGSVLGGSAWAVFS